jgi:hypothetical protein
MLAKPNLSAIQVSWPVIKRTKIFFKPYNTFRARIMAQLLGKLVNHITATPSTPSANESAVQKTMRRTTRGRKLEHK